MSPAGRIYTSWEIILSALTVFARIIFFTTPAPMRILGKKLKSTIYNTIMFINLLLWTFTNCFGKNHLFASILYIIWVLLKVSLSVVYPETWCRVQSWMILTVFAMITRFFPNFVFVTNNTSLLWFFFALAGWYYWKEMTPF